MCELCVSVFVCIGVYNIGSNVSISKFVKRETDWINVIICVAQWLKVKY